MRSPVAMDLFAAWDAAAVSYCHWKSIDHLDAALAAKTDLDVLVARADAEQAEAAARALGFIRFNTVPLRAYPDIEDFIAYDAGVGRLVHLHLHYQLVAGDRWVKAFRLPVEEAMLARSVRDTGSGVWVVAPGDELVQFCARMCVKFRNPFRRRRVRTEAAEIAARLGDPATLDRLAAEYPEPVLALATQVARLGPSDPGLDQASRRARAAMQALRRMGWLEFRLRALQRLAYRMVVEFRRRKLGDLRHGRRRIPGGGLTVAFVGMDGAGKSAAIARTARFFAAQMNVATEFLGSGRSGAPWYRRLVFAIFGTRAFLSRHKAAKPDGGSRRKPWYLLAWIWLCALDRRRALARAEAAMKDGSLVLVDRWPQDQIAGRFDGPRIGEDEATTGFAGRVRDAEQAVMARARELTPHLVLRFVVSPQKALARKPQDMDLATATAAAAQFATIDWPHNLAVVDIDADQAIEAVDAAIRDAIWQCFR